MDWNFFKKAVWVWINKRWFLSEDYVQRFNTKIKNINLNEPITIPNFKGNFMCKSLIVHKTNGFFGGEQRGHYRCFSKIESASDKSEFRWLNISNETCTPMRLPSGLKNVFMLQKQSEIKKLRILRHWLLDAYIFFIYQMLLKNF